MKNTIVVNLFAGPGAGKSTLAAGVFYELKMRGVDCEMAREYAKDLVWQGDTGKLRDQHHVFEEQQRRLDVLNEKVDVIITDSPLLLSLYYAKTLPSWFASDIVGTFNGYNNVNYFVDRVKPYNPNGRMETKDQAIQVDVALQGILTDLSIVPNVIPGNRLGCQLIVNDILRRLQ